MTAAIISIEDKKFYQHGGVDYKAIMRAVLAMLRDGEVTQGGSTNHPAACQNGLYLAGKDLAAKDGGDLYCAADGEKVHQK